MTIDATAVIVMFLVVISCALIAQVFKYIAETARYISCTGITIKHVHEYPQIPQQTYEMSEEDKEYIKESEQLLDAARAIQSLFVDDSQIYHEDKGDN